eukprot:COSAG01_NODE_1744_length_9355_cov_6.094327_4_plen_55_part_00
MPVDGRALMTEEAMALAMRIFARDPLLDIWIEDRCFARALPTGFHPLCARAGGG